MDEISKLTKELNEAKNQIEILKQKNKSVIYVMQHNGKIIYIGKDQTRNRVRMNQHFNERQKILNNYQQIDIYLASTNLDEIQTDEFEYDDELVKDLEKEMIQTFEPICNQQMNASKIHICPKCGKQFRCRGWHFNHVSKCV